jgi:hypothetical protein
MIDLNDDERRTLAYFVTEHINQVKRHEQFTSEPPEFLSAEIEYLDFLHKLKDKLSVK